MTLGRAIGEVATRARFSDIPEAVRERISIHILDTLGVSVAGATAPWNTPVFQYVEASSARGQSSTCFGDIRLAAEGAAMGNATAAHGAELDDFHVPGGVHAGAVIVPAALAVAEELDAGLEELVTASVLGYETTIRIGRALSPEMTADRGFHVTSAFGPIGAAVATGVLRGLDVSQFAHAIGIAIASCGGVTEYTRTGGEIKRFHAGLAARAGVQASALAVSGLTGPAQALEGERGYFHAFSGSRLDRSTFDGFGEEWSADGLGIKPWSTCAGNQPAIAALETLLDQGVDPTRIASVKVWADKTAVGHCAHVGPDPQDMTGLQFSMHIALALRALRRSNSFAEYQRALDGADRGPLTAFGSKIHIHVGEAEEAAFSTRPFATVEVTLVDGTRRSARGTTPGDPGSPLDWAGLSLKLNDIIGVESERFDALSDELMDARNGVRLWDPYARLLPRPAASVVQ
ncbi:MmgE/PrpD family protein [Microbacterium pumilum]|uniref:MmgE/PrpD family protein n=1 Tax=Microbacterium pumilum TaxID=344165 RepID=A0ABP5EFL1_9MICO